MRGAYILPRCIGLNFLAVRILLALGYVLFIKKCYHLNKEYLQGLIIHIMPFHTNNLLNGMIMEDSHFNLLRCN